MKQKELTAVEWLKQELLEHTFSQQDGIIISCDDFDRKIKQAIEMEKEQIIHAFIVAEYNQWDGTRHGVHYYQQKYGKGNQPI